MNAVIAGPGGTTVSVNTDDSPKVFRMKRRFYVGSELKLGGWQPTILEATSPAERQRILDSGRKVYRSFAAAEPELLRTRKLLIGS